MTNPPGTPVPGGRWPDDADARRALETYLRARADPADTDELMGFDLRSADLTGAEFGETAANGCRLAGTILTGAHGSVFGPVDVGPATLDGDDLARWFHDHGAPDVTVLRPRGPRSRRRDAPG